MDTIVTTDWLSEHLHDRDLRVVDTRWYLDPARSGPAAFAAGHLPGAVFLNVDRDLSAPGGGLDRSVSHGDSKLSGPSATPLP